MENTAFGRRPVVNSPGQGSIKSQEERRANSHEHGRVDSPEQGSLEMRSGQAEYLLVVYPLGDLRDRLLEEQQQFSVYYGLDGIDKGLQTMARNKPHITLAAFRAGEEVEDTLIRWIQRICNQQKQFEVALNNYSGIPPHTIYLRVQDPQPFRQLMTQLRAIDDFVRSSGLPPVNLNNRPYLSIAGGLTERVYNKAMPDYSRKTFHGIFRVDELVLLKRGHSFATCKTTPCKTVNIFRLLPEDN
jgi:2'-5' RNA ligase